eukprot:RCo021171
MSHPGRRVAPPAAPAPVLGTPDDGPAVPFAVVSCSAQDPHHPATLLAAAGGKGWQTPRQDPDTLTWPVEVVLSFGGEAKIRAIRVLAHESKIPSRIELFIAEATGGGGAVPVPPPPSQASFRRLGHFSLKPNQESGFKARELKTVFVSARAVYLKLLLHRCHPNSFNSYSQVSLIAVTVIGDLLHSFAGLQQPTGSGGAT